MFELVAQSAQKVSEWFFPGTDRQHRIRIMERDDETWFVASDVCEVLEIGLTADATRRLDADEKDDMDSIHDIGGRRQRMTIINESGLYSLILTSRKPEARTFKKWVTSEVLPSIRKTGSYGTPTIVSPDLSGLIKIQSEFMQSNHAIIQALGSRMEDVSTELVQFGTKLDKVVQNSNYAIQVAESVKNTLEHHVPRRNHSENVRRLYDKVILERYGGRCPVTDEVIMLNGTKTKKGQYDHWASRMDIRKECGWLISTHANVEIFRTPADRIPYEPIFHTFQHNLKLVLNAVNSLELGL